MSILVAYVPNETGERVLETGLQYADRLGLTVHVLNVVNGEAPVEETAATPDHLTHLRTRHEGLPIPIAVEQLMSPDSAEAILDRATELGARLVVIGVRRRSAVGKLLLGSVSQKVILGAEVPVLAVK
ncbi:universal stress protein [Nocardioides alkalitolerans]|uniref:universal stress protein n=1 Tax=Nocardioides alkalitolerans TaxID=281714 RepID=UPI000407758F|nr:universal stress protein [Nocardioides alkalitolerans]